MDHQWRFIPLETYDAYTNLAIDETLFNLKIENPNLPNSIRFYQWNPSAVSIGKNQNLETEVDIENSKKFGVNIVRRISGGGAVFHDFSGELTYHIIVSRNSLENKNPNIFFDIVLRALSYSFAQLGIETDYGQIHCPSLYVRNKKISGNAQAVHKDVILQHGTILLDYNPELMYSVLNARPNKTRKKMVESVYAHITTLSKILNTKVTATDIVKPLKNGFKTVFKIKKLKKVPLTENEWKFVILNKKNRQQSWEWITNNKITPERQIFNSLSKLQISKLKI